MPTLEVCSPVDGALLKSVPVDDSKAVESKIANAQQAFDSWAGLGLKKRAGILYDYRQLLLSHKEELVELIHKENGKTKEEALAETEKAIEVTEFACSLPQIAADRGLEVSAGVYCRMSRQPLGVVSSIVPFNFPLMIPHWTVPIALGLGNTVILKPSDVVPLSSIKMKELLDRAGCPEGVFDLAIGGKEVVEAICEHPDVQAVSFVGATETAKIVYRLATNSLKRALCLGGAKNHLLILPDADPDMTARDVVASMSGMAGQRCMAASAAVAVGACDHIIDKIVSHAKDVQCGKNLGAIISDQAKQRITSYVNDAEKSGIDILLDGRGVAVPGKERGHYFGPTVLDNVPVGSRCATDEIFGPVLSIIRADSVDDAIDIQNGNPYGNGASVYTSSGGMAKYVSERLTAGMVGTNIGVPVPREPFSFGGAKASKFGSGDITGESSIEFWTRLVKYTTKWHAKATTNWMS